MAKTGFIQEFKDFALKGNVMDMAVGVIIGGAFGKIVTSVVNNIIMPPIGVLTGGMDFTKLSYTLKEAEGEAEAVTLNYGQFIQDVVDFLIIAFCIFLLVKGIAQLLQMDLLRLPGATGDTDTDLGAKVDSALQAAQKYPFVLLHINGADEAAHRKKPMEKREFLKRVDAQVLARLITSSHRITVTSDHGTDPNTGQHLGSKQPVFALH